MDDDEIYDAIFKQETVFHNAIMALFRNSGSGVRSCPFCQHQIEIVERSRRLTFAGWEEPCIQYHCDTCGFGGEASI
jgi:hypothetical protein